MGSGKFGRSQEGAPLLSYEYTDQDQSTTQSSFWRPPMVAYCRLGHSLPEDGAKRKTQESYSPIQISSEIPAAISSRQIELRLQELSRQLTVLEEKMNSDVTMILQLVRQSKLQQLSSPPADASLAGSPLHQTAPSSQQSSATDRATAASSTTTTTTTMTSRSRSEPALLPAAAVPPLPSSANAPPQSPAHGAQRRHGALERQHRLTLCDDNDDVV